MSRRLVRCRRACAGDRQGQARRLVQQVVRLGTKRIMKVKRYRQLAVVALLTFILSTAVARAQTPLVVPKPVTAWPDVFWVQEGYRAEVRTEKVMSQMMAREMPFRIILPDGYSLPVNDSKRLPVVYLLHGLTGHFSNWTDKTELAQYAARHNLIVVTPEGDDGWYTDSTAKSNDKYESYIVKELIPEVDKKFRTIANRDHRAIAGLSMGGYGSIKFGLKYPEMFVVVGSFSGALGAASITEKVIPGAIGRSIDAIFGQAGSDTRKSNDIFDLIRKSTPDKIKAFPFLYLDCGT